MRHHQGICILAFDCTSFHRQCYIFRHEAHGIQIFPNKLEYVTVELSGDFPRGNWPRLASRAPPPKIRVGCGAIWLSRLACDTRIQLQALGGEKSCFFESSAIFPFHYLQQDSL